MTDQLTQAELEILPRMRLDVDRFDAFRAEDVRVLLDIIDRLDRAARAARAAARTTDETGAWEALRAAEWVILRGGLRLPDFGHWLERSTSKPSDPDDVRWECSCGYAGSPETVERHWTAMRAALAANQPESTRGFAATRAPEGTEG